jgi:carboxymethylenebutenolidase
MHIAEEDGFVSKEAQAAINAGLNGHDAVTIYNYPGMDHAFARIGGVPYNKENANLANGRSLEAFKQALA